MWTLSAYSLINHPRIISDPFCRKEDDVFIRWWWQRQLFTILRQGRVFLTINLMFWDKNKNFFNLPTSMHLFGHDDDVPGGWEVGHVDGSLFCCINDFLRESTWAAYCSRARTSKQLTSVEKSIWYWLRRIVHLSTAGMCGQALSYPPKTDRFSH